MTDFLFVSGTELPTEVQAQKNSEERTLRNSFLRKLNDKNGIQKQSKDFDIYLIGNPVFKSGFLPIWSKLNPESILKRPSVIADLYRQLSGICGILVIDHVAGKLIFVSDPLGMIPVFLYREGNISSLFTRPTDLLTIGQLNLNWDEDSVQSYLCNGHFILHRTWWKEVGRVKAATILVFDEKDQTWTETRYWRWPEPLHSKRDRKAFRGEIRNIFHRNIQDFRLNGIPSAVALSGGRDSRWLLSVMNEYHPVSTFSFGAEHSPDLEIAGKCARLLRLQHTEYMLSYQNWYQDRLNPFLAAGGMLTMDHFHEGNLNDELSQHYGLVCTGFLGGFAPRGAFVKLSKHSARKHFSFFPESESWADTFYSSSSLHPFLIDQKMTNLAAHHLYHLSRYYKLATPFYHLDYIECFYSSHYDFWEEQYDYTKTIVEDIPRSLAALPWQKTGFALDRIWLNTLWTVYGVDSLLGKFNPSRGGSRAFYDYRKIMEEVNQRISDLSENFIFPADCFKGTNVREQIRLLSAMSWVDEVRKIRNS